jgi:hypothetical protein
LIAARNADIGIVHALDHGASVYWKDVNDGGKTALHACALSSKPSSQQVDDDDDKNSASS